MDIEATNYVVCVWSYGAERSYSYGPFRYIDTAEKFCQKVEKTKGWVVQRIEVLNSPKFFSTGYERSFD